MHIIERLFAISPDGGDGSLELFLLLAPIAAMLLALAVVRISYLQRPSASRQSSG